MVADTLSPIILLRNFLTYVHLAIFQVSIAWAIYKVLKDYFLTFLLCFAVIFMVCPFVLQERIIRNLEWLSVFYLSNQSSSSIFHLS